MQNPRPCRIPCPRETLRSEIPTPWAIFSEQQILNPKLLSVANSCDKNENQKMAKIVHRHMPASHDLPQKIPSPGQNVGCKTSEWGQSFGTNPREWLLKKTDSCIIPNFKLKYEDSENIKIDSADPMISNLRQIKQRNFFGTRSILYIRTSMCSICKCLLKFLTH